MGDFILQELVSVIVPIYNVQDYIERCVHSIIEQTYYNIEILLIDDGSTDDSGKLADEYTKKDERIRVFHKKNGGLSDARNYGILMSSGKYVCFIDSDDFIHKDYIRLLYKICTEQGCEIAQCDYLRTDGSIDSTISSKTTIQLYNNIQMLNNLYGKEYVKSVIVCNKLYKRKLFDDIDFPIGRIHEDEATIYKLFYKANKIGVTEQVLYYYYQRPNSIMQKKYNLKRMDILWAIENRRRFFKENGLNDLFYKDNYKMLTKILKNYYEVLHANDIANKNVILKELRMKYKEVFAESKGANWTWKRQLMLTVFKYIPRYYVPVIRFKMSFERGK